jgi:plastocyanin
MTIILSFAAQAALADTSPVYAVDHSTKAIAFQRDMRQLWEEHVLWTRMMIISVAGNQQDLGAATDRLMQNQVDIGNAIKPYYGDAAGNKLTSLLKDHISTAAELLVASKAGDAPKTNDAKQRWYTNGDNIAVFLSSANPQNWPLNTMKSMMTTHLDTTLDEAAARFHGDWKADVAAFDKARLHVLMMSDALSSGIIHQFPKSFAEKGTDPASVQVRIADSVFEPKEITVSPGTTVKWVNTGKRPHTVTADSTNPVSGGPDSSTIFPNGLRSGDSFTWTVPADSTRGAKWFYHCTFHGSEGGGRSLGSGMSGVIVVQ